MNLIKERIGVRARVRMGVAVAVGLDDGGKGGEEVKKKTGKINFLGFWDCGLY
jgi:hypothetical protein